MSASALEISSLTQKMCLPVLHEPEGPGYSAHEGPLPAKKKLSRTASNVVVVEQNPNTRSRLAKILCAADDFKLVGNFSNSKEAVNAIPQLRPDLMLLGVRQGEGIGLKCISLLKRILAGLKIIVVLGIGDPDLLEASSQAGADGCLVKPVSAGQCLATLRFAERSQKSDPIAPPQRHLKFAETMNSTSCVPLSQREIKVMEGLATGLLYKEIGDQIGMSYWSVRKYQQKIYRKLHVSNRTEATRAWLGLQGHVD